MRRLHRPATAPVCLSKYKHGKDNWSLSSPTGDERNDIWRQLIAMQGQRCAYCEGPLDRDNGHIEHFRQRGRYPAGTFDWGNLFGSCNRSGTCGDHKDKCGAYPPNELIKPDIEDPEDFLVFTPNGALRPRQGLSDPERHRALRTIDILQLDGALNRIRYSEVSGYLQTAEAFAELAEHFPPEDWLPELELEIAATAHLPFATAIRHVLTRQSAE